MKDKQLYAWGFLQGCCSDRMQTFHTTGYKRKHGQQWAPSRLSWFWRCSWWWAARAFEGHGLQRGWAGGTVDLTRGASSLTFSLDWEGALEMNSAVASSDGVLVQIVQKAWRWGSELVWMKANCKPCSGAHLSSSSSSSEGSKSRVQVSGPPQWLWLCGCPVGPSSSLCSCCSNPNPMDHTTGNDCLFSY